MKKNYAFISYSRKNLDIAKYFQERLEKYPYPTEKIDKSNIPYDSKYIRPIFLDITDLSSKERDFTDELKKSIEDSKYLLVICSKESAESDFVRKEIEYFYVTHNQNSDLILPIIVNQVIDKFHPIIDEIVSKRNCPIYFTENKYKEHQLDNKYCFYHIIEFLLKIDFHILFNRYIAYAKRRERKRLIFLSLVFILITCFLSYGLYKAHRLSQFEKKTFPYSLVVGYIGNFMSPLLNCMDTIPQKDFIVLMPNKYNELDNIKRGNMYYQYIKQHYNIDNLHKETYQSKTRKRELDIISFKLQNKTIYLDLANTVSAFRFVIDYKVNNDLYLYKSKDEMVKEYTSEFIQSAKDSLRSQGNSIVFVKDTFELKQILDSILYINK